VIATPEGCKNRGQLTIEWRRNMGPKEAGMPNMCDCMPKMPGPCMGPSMGMPMMDMMTQMLPTGFSMMMGRLPKEQRLKLAKEMISVMADKACEGLTKEEKDAFFEDLKVK
jgi:hypothetical protein